MTHTNTPDDPSPLTPALLHTRSSPVPPALLELQEFRERVVPMPPALLALQELRDRAFPPILRMRQHLLRVAAQVTPILEVVGGAALALRELAHRAAPVVIRLLPHLRQAVKMAEAIAREEDTAWDAFLAVHYNQLTWLRSFTVHTLDLPPDHVGAVIEALHEGDWREAPDPTRHLARDARRRYVNEQRRSGSRLLLRRNQGWLDVEADPLPTTEGGVDTDPGPGFARLFAQMDLRRVVQKALPEDEAMIAVLLTQGYSEQEVMDELGLSQRELWAARKRMARRGVVLLSRRSPGSGSG